MSQQRKRQMNQEDSNSMLCEAEKVLSDLNLDNINLNQELSIESYFKFVALIGSKLANDSEFVEKFGSHLKLNLLNISCNEKFLDEIARLSITFANKMILQSQSCELTKS